MADPTIQDIRNQDNNIDLSQYPKCPHCRHEVDTPKHPVKSGVMHIDPSEAHPEMLMVLIVYCGNPKCRKAIPVSYMGAYPKPVEEKLPENQKPQEQLIHSGAQAVAMARQLGKGGRPLIRSLVGPGRTRLN